MGNSMRDSLVHADRQHATPFRENQLQDRLMF